MPRKHKEGEFNLGSWLQKQRHRIDNLSEEQIYRLDALGFVWNPHEKLWIEGLNKLQQFHQREGHCLVPSKHQEEGHNLGTWVVSQRRKKPKLSKEQISELDAIGFVWGKIT